MKSGATAGKLTFDLDGRVRDLKANLVVVRFPFADLIYSADQMLAALRNAGFEWEMRSIWRVAAEHQHGVLLDDLHRQGVTEFVSALRGEDWAGDTYALLFLGSSDDAAKVRILMGHKVVPVPDGIDVQAAFTDAFVG